MCTYNESNESLLIINGKSCHYYKIMLSLEAHTQKIFLSEAYWTNGFYFS